MDQQYSSLHLKISEKQLREIESFVREFDFSNRTEAIRFLLATGLKYQNGLLKNPQDDT